MIVESWATESIADCLIPVSVTGKAKIQSQDYKSSGRFPVIDQGQEQIAGWTDDESAVIDKPLPLIVFGDHTRVFKFLDRPFARGADGTQLLRPKPGINPLFFFYACRAIDLPARGYNRHFTVLKEKQFSYPTDDGEQKAIATVLRRTESALDQQSSLLDTLQKLKRAAMRELFTRGLRGEPQKETEIGPVPESWRVTPVADLATVKGGKRMPKGVALVQEDTGRPYIRVTDFKDHSVREEGILFVPKGYERVIERYRISSRDVYISIAGTIGLVGQVPEKLDDANLTENAAKLVFEREDVFPRFVMYALAGEACQDQICRATAKNAQPKLALTRIESIQVPIPSSIDEQREIVAILDAIDRKIDLHRKKRAVLEELFKALLHELMTGEIRVGDLDLSALEPQRMAAATP